MPPFSEARLEQLFTERLAAQGFVHSFGGSLKRSNYEQVLLTNDLARYLKQRYRNDGLTDTEIGRIITDLERLPASDLYTSNREVMDKVSNGFVFKRDQAKDKDLYIELLSSPQSLYPLRENSLRGGEQASVLNEAPLPHYLTKDQQDFNIYRFVTQLKLVGVEDQERIPDGILYINGLPLVLFEFKSTVREEPTIHAAYVQITARYQRDIPELLKYNAFCVISDGINNRIGSSFAKYEFFYTWRRIDEPILRETKVDSMDTLIRGLFDKRRLLDVLRNFVFFPDTSPPKVKIVCRYPQYYAARKLYANVLEHMRPHGDGRGGTYFGATGCGKSYTMLFLARLLMKSVELGSPTLVLITDRTDLDTQLSKLFEGARNYLGDKVVQSVESRAQLRELLEGRQSGGVFLTTIHKFTEDAGLLTKRANVICISDEAHRSQVNLDQKVRITEMRANGAKGPRWRVEKRYGFAKYLHDSLPNATYVGFTGTPIDATLEVFGPVEDSYTMTESVADGITVRIVREGRAAKVTLESSALKRIEDYYAEAAAQGANEYQVEASKKDSANMNAILGDPKRLRALAEDFVGHYEKRVAEGSTVAGKAMFVSSNRTVAYDFYRAVTQLRPEWIVPQQGEDADAMPLERIKLVMSRGKDDEESMYEALGTKDYRKTLDEEFKKPGSNFKIAVVVDMWLTGFDVPELDTIYIDKPIQRHNLIQTISRVNRKFTGKSKGLVVDYIGIKKQMNLAMAMYNAVEAQNIEDIAQSVSAVRDQLDLLEQVFHNFDTSGYFSEDGQAQLDTLRLAAEHVQLTQKQETRFMGLVRRLKAAYDICVGGDQLLQSERDWVHFYLAVRSIVYKLSRDDTPDTAQMNARVQEMIAAAIASDGVEELFTIDGTSGGEDIFSDEYLEKIEKIKLPHTKIKLLQKLLSKAIKEFKQINLAKGTDFSEQMKALVDRYNDRTENDTYRGEVAEDMVDQIIDMLRHVRDEMNSNDELNITIQEKAFYDILFRLCVKYDFTYPEDKLLVLAKAVKTLVDDKSRFTDWNEKADIKAELKMELIILLDVHNYPPVTRDEVYQEIFAQAENYKRYRG